MNETVKTLINTSVEDCKSTLPHIESIELLNLAATEAVKRNMKSKLVLITRRIIQLQEQWKG